MNDLLKKTLKTAAIWFAAGALFALGANFAAPLLGGGEIAALAQGTNPAWLGSLLAGTGVIATLVEPALNFIFGQDNAQAKGPTEVKQVNVTVVKTHQPGQGQAHAKPQQMQQMQACAKHADQLEAQRLAQAIANDQLGKSI